MKVVIKFIFALVCLSLAPATLADVLRSENTAGVETVEAPPIQFFLSPSMGMTSFLGNGAMETNSHMGYGVGAGLLLSQQLLFELTYRHRQEGVSLPRNSALVALPGMDASEVYSYTGNAVDLGTRLFVLGRDSRFRPYLSAGIAYSWNKLNYSQAALTVLGSADTYSRDFSLKQAQARGGIGLEVALTSLIVLNAQFEFQGVMSYWASKAGDESGSLFDSDKLAIANSLSRAVSYTSSVGLGFYF